MSLDHEMEEKIEKVLEEFVEKLLEEGPEVLESYLEAVKSFLPALCQLFVLQKELLEKKVNQVTAAELYIEAMDMELEELGDEPSVHDVILLKLKYAGLMGKNAASLEIR